MKYKQFLQPLDKNFSSPKAVGKLLLLLAWLLLLCLFCGFCFYWGSSLNNEISKRRRVMNDEVYSVQESLFQREALLLHFSRSVHLNAQDVVSAPEALKAPLGQDQRKRILLGNYDSPWSLTLSGRDIRELEEFQLGLVYVSNNADHTISHIYDRSFDHYVLPNSVLNALAATTTGKQQFIWLNDPSDPLARIYIFRRISNSQDAGWLGLEIIGEQLAAGLLGRGSDRYLLLNRAHQQVLSSEPDKDLSAYFSRVWSKDDFGFTGRGLNPGYLSLNKSIGGSRWTLIYYVPFKSLLASLWWDSVFALLVFGLMAVGVQRLVLRINRRLVSPALHRLEALIESEEFSRTVIDTAPVALCVLRRLDGQVVLENRLCVQWFKDDEQRIDLHQDWILRAFDYNEHVTEELETASGHHLFLSSVPTRYNGEDVLFCSFSDISARKQMELALARAKQHSDSANEAKSVFLATISHEIRTPLYGLLGTLELLGLTKLEPQQANYLDAMQRSASTLGYLINDVLDVSKIEAGQLVLELDDFNPCELVRELIQVFSATALRKGLVLQAFCDPKLPMSMRGDVARIRQILSNLLGNALKFTDSGRVVLRVRGESRDGERLNLLWQVTDTGSGIREEEQSRLFEPFYQAGDRQSRAGGTGLGLSICQRLAELMNGDIRLVSTYGLGSSFTLSLPLELSGAPSTSEHDVRLAPLPVFVSSPLQEAAENVCGWLNRWGASAQVLNSTELQLPPKATLVELTTEKNALSPLLLPNSSRVWAYLGAPEKAALTDTAWEVNLNSIYAIGQAVSLAQGSIQTHTETGTEPFLRLSQRVLVIEDNPINQLVLKEQLEVLGCEVTLASDGREGLMLWACGIFDLVLTDINMPDMDGHQLARQLRSAGCTVPIVGATANTDPAETARCLDSGMDLCLTKPVDLLSLFNSLNTLTPEKIACVP
ncbi:hybrid sensor histidine kinase/response regulator [Pseudomonas poae]|uniref:histidine kinase n=1 Tax=Pseudomonas poae TaxID=200451 RepID=A0A423FL20_9PSED|nr:ATP-binding protein [Pseudomonas poae]ROM59560.1 hybrid sensor histidine kinase/response regulator [Pseudomonas poae]